MITLEAQKPAPITVPLLQGNYRELNYIMKYLDEFDVVHPLDLSTFDEVKMSIRDKVNVNTKPFLTKSSITDYPEITISGSDNNVITFSFGREFWQTSVKTYYADLLITDGGKDFTLIKFTFPVDPTITKQP